MKHLLALAALLLVPLAADAQLRPADEARIPFWQRFDDPLLTRHVREALARNGDVQAAWQRVRQVDAIADQSFARLLPVVNGVVQANVAPLGTAAPPGFASSDTRTTGQAGLTADWELDVSGRNYTAWRATRFDTAAARGDRDSLALAVATRVADTYFDLIQTQQQVAVLESQLAINTELLELMELRYDAGAASAQEVLQQRQQVALAATQLPQTRQLARTLALQLAVLTGNEPSVAPEAAAELPQPPPLPQEGIPAALVDARPDLRASQARISAADARQSVAVRTLFPTLRLNGQAGWNLQRLGGETTTDEAWSVGGTFSVPLFAGGANVAGIRAARAAELAEIATYRQTALLAVQEVDAALLRIEEQERVVEAAALQVEVGGMAFEEAEARYLAGLGNYLSVLTANTAWQQARLSLIQARRTLLAIHVQLYAALGGAWTEDLGSEGTGS